MARPPADDDDLPWLAEGVREERSTLVPRARLFGGGLLALALAVLVALGVYLAVGHKSDGSAGYVRPEDAPLITADAGAYKTTPADPGGAQITGIDDAIATAASGADQGSAILPDTAEEPLARPGTPGAKTATPAPPTDLLPATIPPAAIVPPAVTTHPATAPAAVPPRPIVAAPIVAPRVVAEPAKAAPLKPRLEPVTRPDKPRDDAAADPLAAAPSEKPAKPIKKPTKADAAPASGATADEAPAKPASGATAKSGPAALQLGAFSTRDKAVAAWAKAGGDGALSGLAQRIEPIERDGKTLYRLRAGGVASKDAAKALCARVTAAGNACIVAE